MININISIPDFLKIMKLRKYDDEILAPNGYFLKKTLVKEDFFYFSEPFSKKYALCVVCHSF